MESIRLAAVSTESRRTPSYLNILKCKCPRCREGNMFKEANPYKLRKTMRMHEKCISCGQVFDIEVGFYYGSSYVSYALAVAISVATLVIWALTIGISTQDNRYLYWIICNAVLLISFQPYLMRLARALWLSFFVHYDRNWRINPPKRAERTNKTHQNNW